MWHAFEIAAVLYVATVVLMLVGEASWRRWLYRSAIWLACVSVSAATWFVWQGAREDRSEWPLAANSHPVQDKPRRGHAGPGSGQPPMLLTAEGIAGIIARGREPEAEPDTVAADSATPEAPDAARRAAPPRLAGEVVQDCDACPEMVILPAGTFTLGADAGDAQADAAERPARIRHVWPGFAIGRTEVTVAQYQRFVAATGHRQPNCNARVADASGTLPAGTPIPFVTERHPATCIDQRDAQAYAGWLAAVSGKRFRLASAAEWEYAAKPPAPAAVAPESVGQFGVQAVAAGAANAWGIHDMGGNVAELVADCWHDGIDRGSGSMRALSRAGCRLRMLKDGAASEEPRWRRASARRTVAADALSPVIGFRVARDLDRRR